jgi:hypothetical protein
MKVTKDDALRVAGALVIIFVGVILALAGENYIASISDRSGRSI